MPNAFLNAHEPTEAEIQHTAYLLWLESGRQPNRDLDNWLAAKELLRHHHGKGSRPHPGHGIPPAIPPMADAKKR